MKFLNSARRQQRANPSPSLSPPTASKSPRTSRSEHGPDCFPIRNSGSLEKPQRYVVVTSIEQDGKNGGRYETPFGIRTIEFTVGQRISAERQRVPLNGVCDHHDLGALGAAINTRALERQIEILKELGCNAIRTSHNPPAPELLDLCDRLGMLVMDEAFDCWENARRERLSPAVRRLARERLARGTAPRPQSSVRHFVEHRQRSRRAGPPAGSGSPRS
jgi:beta-galactosidase/beta-glucuronidase